MTKTYIDNTFLNSPRNLKIKLIILEVMIDSRKMPITLNVASTSYQTSLVSGVTIGPAGPSPSGPLNIVGPQKGAGFNDL